MRPVTTWPGNRDIVVGPRRDWEFDVFNLCSGVATPLKDLLQLLAASLNRDGELLQFGRRSIRPGEDLVNFGENSKARKILNWSPVPLREGIEKYVASVNDP